jgi:hypothetical protein
MEQLQTEKIDATPLRIEVKPDGRMDAKNAARYIGLSPKTLAIMRCKGRGPKFLKRGLVFYFKEDIDAWIRAVGRSYSTQQAEYNEIEAWRRVTA